jgi:uncharacterized GH25 family protein
MNFKLGLFGALSLGLATSAQAHDSWLEPKSFQTRTSARVPVSFYVGHHGEQRTSRLAPRPKWLLSMQAYGPQRSTDLLSTRDYNPARGVLFTAPGTHLLALSTADFRHQMKPADFPAYMEEEGLAAAQVAWKRAPIRSRSVREVYRRYAKALVQVGSRPTNGAATRRLGQLLEIVPASNPYQLRAGSPLRATIWYSGKPLAGALVTLGSLDRPKDELISVRSDAAGKASFTMPASGRWMMNVVWGVPSSRAGTDFQTSFSSLTFAVPAAS